MRTFTGLFHRTRSHVAGGRIPHIQCPLIIPLAPSRFRVKRTYLYPQSSSQVKAMILLVTIAGDGSLVRSYDMGQLVRGHSTYLLRALDMTLQVPTGFPPDGGGSGPGRMHMPSCKSLPAHHGASQTVSVAAAG